MKRVLSLLMLSLALCPGLKAYYYFTFDNVRYCFDPESTINYMTVSPTSDFRYGLPMMHDSAPTSGMDLENNYAGVTDVVIPASVEYYAYDASWDNFDPSQSVNYAVLGIDEGAFAFANAGQGLTSIALPPSLRSVGYLAFYGTPIERVDITDLEAWCNIRFLMYETTYGHDGAYSDYIATTPTGTWHRNLTYGEVTDVVEPNGELWLNGQRLTDLVVPSTVQAIGNYAFLGCQQLLTATIPASVSQIGDMALAGCTGLQQLQVEASEPPALGKQVFRDIDTEACTLQVPADAVEKYRAAEQWSAFGNIVEIGSTTPSINADVNGDGRVDIDDVNIVVNKILGK